MLSDKVRKTTPEQLNGNDSIYDYQLHLPIPSITFIEGQAFFNFSKESGSVSNANLLLKMLSRSAMNVIKSSIPTNAGIKIEYLIAKSKEHRTAFLLVVVDMVLASRGVGIKELLSTGNNDKPMEYITRIAQNSIKANGLNAYNYSFVLIGDDIRRGY